MTYILTRAGERLWLTEPGRRPLTAGAAYHDWATGRYRDPELEAAIAAWPRKRAERRELIRRGRDALSTPAAQAAVLWRRVHGDIPMTAAGRRDEWERLRALVDQWRR